MRPFGFAVLLAAAITQSGAAVPALADRGGSPSSLRTTPQPTAAFAAVPSAVLSRVRAGRRVRIIVGLHTPAALVPEGTLVEGDIGVRRAAIRSVQGSLLEALGNFSIRDIKRFAIIPATSMEVDEAALQALVARPEVSYIEEDRLLEPAISASERLTGAVAAWFNGYSGLGATVAILDTGVDRSHPYFSGGRVVSEACYSTTSDADGSTALCTPGSTEVGAAAPCSNIAGCGHGTVVAAIAAADEDPPRSFLPVRGVAPGATIVAVQVFSRLGEAHCVPDGKIPRPCLKAFMSDVVSGLERVYELRNSYNIAAANISLGVGRYSTQASCDADYPSFKAIIDSLRSVGIATVAAAGDESHIDALAAPACISSAVSVGSSPYDATLPFSNSASFLSLLAPAQIPFPTGERVLATSRAAAHVTGAWALLKGRFKTVSVDVALNALVTTGNPITDPRNGLTKPHIDVDAAIAAMGPPCTYTITPAEILVGHGGATASVRVATAPDCPWTVFRHEPYVILARPGAGVGPGQATFDVLPNPTTSRRSTTIDIVHQEIVIQQAVELPTRLPADLNMDGRLDLLWQHQGDGRIAVWLMAGSTLIDGRLLSPPQVPDTTWKIAGAGDLDADGLDDLVWQNVADGRVSAWFMNGTTLRDGSLLGIPQVPDLDWRIRAVSDVNGDGRSDLWWQHRTTGGIAVWLMNGLTVLAGIPLTALPIADAGWQIVGTGDFDGDHTNDLVWQHLADGRIAVWLMSGTSLVEETVTAPGQVPDINWKIRAVGDVNGDGKPDLIWQKTDDGRVSVWLMDGLTLTEGRLLTPPQVPDTYWQIVGPR